MNLWKCYIVIPYFMPPLFAMASEPDHHILPVWLLSTGVPILRQRHEMILVTCSMVHLVWQYFFSMMGKLQNAWMPADSEGEISSLGF